MVIWSAEASASEAQPMETNLIAGSALGFGIFGQGSNPAATKQSYFKGWFLYTSRLPRDEVLYEQQP